MDHLHAYWRMEYIEAPRLPEGANVFAELPKLGSTPNQRMCFRC